MTSLVACLGLGVARSFSSCFRAGCFASYTVEQVPNGWRCRLQTLMSVLLLQ